MEPMRNGLKPGGGKPRALRAFRRDECVAQRQAIEAGKIAFHGLSHGHYPGTRLSSGALPGLLSIGYWDAVGMQDWGMDVHRNEGLEISLLDTGGIDFTVGKGVFQLGPGNLTVTCPWQLHRHGGPQIGPGRFNWFILDVGALTPKESWQWPAWAGLFPHDLQELSRRLRGSHDCVWKASPDVIYAFRRLAGYLAGPDPSAHFSALRLNIGHVLLGLLEMLRARKTVPEAETNSNISSFHAVHDFLKQLSREASLLRSAWTIETMASRCGFGVTALTAHCHAITNTTPMDYLNLLRLSWAAEQLRAAPDHSITQIALDAGFSSSAYFATRFRERYGRSPRDYRLS